MFYFFFFLAGAISSDPTWYILCTYVPFFNPTMCSSMYNNVHAIFSGCDKSFYDPFVFYQVDGLNCNKAKKKKVRKNAKK